jgi:fructose-bisphosphate aldolase class II
VRKVNIDTDTRLAIVGRWRRIAHQAPAEFDPRQFLKPSMEAMTDLCRRRYEDFGAAGQASRLGPIHSLDAMAARYRTGELDPKIV